MCGIAGGFVFSETSTLKTGLIENAVAALKHRGPDFSSVKTFRSAVLGHARLSIIDTSSSSNQPFTDAGGNFHIVFNGEIFNYKQLRTELEAEGIKFRTNGDVEVLLELFKRFGSKGLEKIKGFFAAGIYNEKDHSFFIVRDRFGVKPLYYFADEDRFFFASEVRALLCFDIDAKPDTDSLYQYLQLNYIPGSNSIFSKVKQLLPGHCLVLSEEKKIVAVKYYDLPSEIEKEKRSSVVSPEKHLRNLLEESVSDRLVADVPVGCFLSGGIDSTVIAGIASGLTKNLSTFCLGFKDNKWFNESPFAETAAKKFKTEHHTFMLSNDDLLSELYFFLDALDEPFADSSALNVFILSKRTKPFVKTVLSGDGADEIFGGYNKHRAEWLIENSTKHRLLAGGGSAFSFLFPKSRNSGLANKMRQLQKFSSVMNLSARERYWKMASISSEKEASLLMKGFHSDESEKRKAEILREIKTEKDLNQFLLTDVNLVLESDMLVKVDRMSMAHGLEVRNPFLDHRLVAWALSLNSDQKINSKEGKIILKKTFSELIPQELLNRKKHGFEVPLHKWMNNELKKEIDENYLGKDFIDEQGIFSYPEIQKIKAQLFSASPGDSAARAWALFVFNYWYKKNSTYFA